ncbi:hypothetical protein [Chryseobacterium indologenes]|uniref:Uncharacterized protein n=1 Tax=Chryseobacterium indologenes TaxID=253 RepID=A0A0N0ZVJ8_CHRID|nr:hypothetical protein [Chryseobacterium indologenes]KPE49019.1 hypothetical protein AOB46_22210 [Chryseobacterium indologenes]
MKMDRLNLKLLVFTFLISISFCVYGQSNINLIILINDEIVTNSLELRFNSMSHGEYTVNYYPGKEITVSTNDIFKKEDVILKFEHQGFDGAKKIKTYNYNIPISRGLFYDTDYLIVKIYNLDIKRFRSRYCKYKDDYVVEFKNRRYYMDVIRCK